MPNTGQFSGSFGQGRGPLLDTLRRAIEHRDADQVTSLFADDAELRIISKNHKPSAPQVLRGKSEIAKYLKDVYGRAMTHELQDPVVGEDGLSFLEACRYDDGTRVLGSTTIKLRDGKIARETVVEAWDE